MPKPVLFPGFFSKENELASQRFQSEEAVERHPEAKIVTGYTCQGLPFLILVDAPNRRKEFSARFIEDYNGQTSACHDFIDHFVSPLISDYAMQLAASERANIPDLTKVFIKNIAQLRNQHAPNTAFSLALATTYMTANEKLEVAGFSIGGSGIAIRKSGTIDMLAYNIFIEHSNESYQDAFDSTTNIELASARNSIFFRPIKPGNELVAYSALPKELEVEQFKELRKGRKDCVDYTVVQYALAPEIIPSPDCSFLTSLSEEITKTAAENTILASCMIPTNERQAELATILRRRTVTAITKAAEDYIEWSNAQAKGFRLFRGKHFYHGTSGRDRINQLLTNIRDNPDNENILFQAAEALNKSGVRGHSFSRYLYDALNQPQDSVIDQGISDEQFETLKTAIKL